MQNTKLSIRLRIGKLFIKGQRVNIFSFGGHVSVLSTQLCRGIDDIQYRQAAIDIHGCVAIKLALQNQGVDGIQQAGYSCSLLQPLHQRHSYEQNRQDPQGAFILAGNNSLLPLVALLCNPLYIVDKQLCGGGIGNLSNLTKEKVRVNTQFRLYYLPVSLGVLCILDLAYRYYF